METLHDLRRCYVPERPAQVQFPRVTIEYTYRQLYIYIQGCRVEIQTATHRNLTGRSMTTPPPCCRPTIFFRHLNLIAFLSWQGRIRRSLQKWDYFKLYFLLFLKKNYVSLNCVTWNCASRREYVLEQ